MKDGSQAVDTLFEILDINGDGLVNYYEFLNIALSTVSEHTADSSKYVGNMMSTYLTFERRMML